MNWFVSITLVERLSSLFRRLVFLALFACFWCRQQGVAGADVSTPGQASTFPSEGKTELTKQAVTIATLPIGLEVTEKQEGIDVPKFYGGPTTYRAYFEGNKFYLRTTSLYPKVPKPRIHEDSFDGSLFYYGDLEAGANSYPSVLKKYIPGDATDQEQLTPIYFGYFAAAGMLSPQQISDLKGYTSLQIALSMTLNEDSGIKVALDGEKIRMTAEIPDRLVLNARSKNIEWEQRQFENTKTSPAFISKYIEQLKEMQRMPARRTVKYLIDPKRGYGIVEREDFTQDGRRIQQLETDEWKYYRDVDMWLPHHCVERYYSQRFALTDFSESPRLTVTYDVSKVAFQQQELAFNLEYKKQGSLIIDRSTPEAQRRPEHTVAYIVAANGSLLEETASSVMNEVHGRRTFLWILLVNILVIGCFLIRKITGKKSPDVISLK